jgi:DNA-binding NtrC family response regulator
MTRENAFREDLYYRLCNVTLHLPPLRERKDDIPALVESILPRLPVGYKKKIDDEALAILVNYGWPGNIRELRNVLSRAAILSDSDSIVSGDLPAELTSVRNAPGPKETLPSLDELEREHIARVLAHSGGQKKKTADILGIDIKTLYRKMKKYAM